MRPLEIALVAGELGTFAVLVTPRLRAIRWLRYLVFVGVALSAAQALLEGPRWQLVPAYVLSVAFVLASWLQGSSKRDAAPRPLWAKTVLGSSVVLGGVALVPLVSRQGSRIVAARALRAESRGSCLGSEPGPLAKVLLWALEVCDHRRSRCPTRGG